MNREHGTVTLPSVRSGTSWLHPLLATVLLGGCASAGGDSSSATSTRPSVSAPGSSTLTSPTSPAPEGAGVSGLDDPDPFCAAWAAYGATVQALAVAGAFGDLDDLALARLELVAAPALVEAVTGIGGRWPSELLAERTLVVADLVGPFGRRAQKAVQALEAAGAGEAELAELSSLWMVALRTRRDDRPVIEVPAESARSAAVVDAAAVAFDAAVTPFGGDPSLIVDMTAAPATTAYLAATCPAVSASGVGDRI